MVRWSEAFRVRQSLKGSLWFLPLLGGVCGVLLAILDYRYEQELTLSEHWTYTASTASGILTAIVGAMVALLGFVVTIGVLVVQTATGTLSPRFMRLWYRNRLQKVVLATFAGTLTFSFTLLRRITEQTVPNLGVTVAGVLVTVSVMLLLLYLDHFVHALRPVAVGALVAEAGLRVLGTSWPVAAPGAPTGPPPGGPLLTVPTPAPGVIQAVNAKRLVAAAYRSDCLIVLARIPGDFVPAGAVLMRVYGPGTAPDPRDLAGLVALGRERTIDQDPAFALRILVDIAIRALSPAVNDPTTAVQMIDQIETFLRGIARTGPHEDLRSLADETGTVRVLVPGRRFEVYLELALTEIVHFGAGSPQVTRRLSAMLRDLAEIVGPGDRSAVHAVQAGLAVAVEKAGGEPLFDLIPDNQGLGEPRPPGASSAA